MSRPLLALLLLWCGAAVAQTIGEVPVYGLTPGVIAEDGHDPAEVCGIVDGLSYSKRHRATPEGLKVLIFRKYGIDPVIARTQDWEIDHLLPLALGGQDSVYNLWAEPGNGLGVCYTYHMKDQVEVYLWRQVCKSGTMSLADAQQDLLLDWRIIYRHVFGTPACDN